MRHWVEGQEHVSLLGRKWWTNCALAIVQVLLCGTQLALICAYSRPPCCVHPSYSLSTQRVVFLSSDCINTGSVSVQTATGRIIASASWQGEATRADQITIGFAERPSFLHMNLPELHPLTHCCLSSLPPTAGVFLPLQWCASCSTLIAAHNTPWNADRDTHAHTSVHQR